MRVVQVAPTPFGRSGLFGGGERYPLELARALAAEVDCTLITFGRQATEARESGGLRLRVVRARGYLGGHPAHPIPLGLSRALAGADLVHAHHLRSLPTRLAGLTARALGQRAVATDHGLSGSDWLGLLYRLFDRYLMVSRYSAKVLGTPADRTRVIYGGADPARFTPDPDLRRRGVLFVGRLTPHKGVDRLLAALPAGAHLTIAGSAGHDPRLPERDYPLLLSRLAADKHVSFLGPVEDGDLPGLYRRARVLVLPSVHRTCYGRYVAVSELLGLVVLEAMASGTPVIASHLGGLSEVVEDGVTGFLVEPGNVDELRERLEQVLGDQTLASRLGRSARDRVIDRYTWHAVADRCLSAYNELLATPDSPSSM